MSSRGLRVASGCLLLVSVLAPLPLGLGSSTKEIDEHGEQQNHEEIGLDALLDLSLRLLSITEGSAAENGTEARSANASHGGLEAVCVDNDDWLADALATLWPGTDYRVTSSCSGFLTIGSVCATPMHTWCNSTYSHPDCFERLFNLTFGYDYLCCASCKTYHQAYPVAVSFLQTLGFDVPPNGDLCTEVEGVSCGFPWGLDVRSHGRELNGQLSDDICKFDLLNKLEVTDAGLQGGLPEGLGACTRMHQLRLRGNNLTGEVPATWSQLVNMQVFDLASNQLTGQLSPDLWSTWSSIRAVDISDNRLSGFVPNINLALQIHLTSVSVASNRFTGLGELAVPSSVAAYDDQDGVVLALNLSFNTFNEFPEQLKHVPRLTELYLQGNQIHPLPVWGHWSKFHPLEQMVGSGKLIAGAHVWCPWDQGEDWLMPPTWPSLHAIDLSGNPLNTTVAHLVALLVHAPSLSTLRCTSCSLMGEGLETGYFFRVSGVPQTLVDDLILCGVHQAFPELSSADLSANPAILACDIVELTEKKQVVCSQCPGGSQVPSAKTPPLRSSLECVCREGMKRYFTATGDPICACPSYHYLDEGTGSCNPCTSRLACAEPGDWQRTLAPPGLRPGSWMPCFRDGEIFSEARIMNCYSARACTGGEVTKDVCTETSMCAENRTGRACGLCAPGHYGGPEGSCMLCSYPPRETARNLAIFCVVLVPLLFLGIQLLGGDDGRRVSALANFRTLRQLTRRLGKHLQLVAVVSNINVAWPAGLQKAFEFLRSIMFNFDVLLQTDCLAADASFGVSLVSKWVTPLGIVALTGLAYTLSQMLSRGLSTSLSATWQHLGCALKSDSSRLIAFLYMMWTFFFAGLIRNCFLIFLCTGQPDGTYTVREYPTIMCMSGTWWPFAIGGVLASLVYIGLFFFVTKWAVMQTSRALLQNWSDLGPYAFAVDGLRLSCVEFNLNVAMKDVLLNLVLVFLPFSPTSQLFVSASILTSHCLVVILRRPFDSFSANLVETWTSGCLAVMLLLTSGFGYAGHLDFESAISASKETDDLDSRLHGAWLKSILLASVALPLALVMYEILLSVPFFKRCVPDVMQPLSGTAMRSQIEQVKRDLDGRIWHILESADVVEWHTFLHLVYGSSVLPLVRAEEAGAVQNQPRTSSALGSTRSAMQTDSTSRTPSTQTQLRGIAFRKRTEQEADRRTVVEDLSWRLSRGRWRSSTRSSGSSTRSSGRRVSQGSVERQRSAPSEAPQGEEHGEGSGAVAAAASQRETRIEV